MSALIDDLSRIVASPVTRRKAFRLMGKAMGGAALASLGWGRPSRGLGAPTTCGHDQKSCGGKCYPGTYTCCTGTNACPKGQKCCGSACCAEVQPCCNGTCCAWDQTCCNGACCASNRTCCNETCCTAGQTCCNGTCCAAGQCAGSGSHRICCPVGRAVCGTAISPTCCPPGYVCCANHKCQKHGPSTSDPCFG